jgi:D-erythronate 2-dehydrogenase
MQIIITGGGGFIGQLLAKNLCKSEIIFDELLLADISFPTDCAVDPRIKYSAIDLSDNGAAEKLITNKTSLIFHLAAIVSSHAEKDFDLGWKVNMAGTLNLLEACRKQTNIIKIVFASSCAVFGGELPDMVTDQTALKPQSSYGTQKAIGELLINDYSRKGFIDGRSLRLPTVCIRPGKPNLAASSFVSSIIREPINGQNAVCPVAIDLAVWISSPNTIIQNFIIAANLDSQKLGDWRTINLPGIQVRVSEMIESLQRQTNKQIIEKIEFCEDKAINKIVKTWPTLIDNSYALKLGFKVDENFDDFIIQYKAHLKQ